MSFLQQLVTETWVEYCIATMVVILRYYTRIRLVGIRRLDYDDFLMPVAWLFFTAMSMMAHIVSLSGDNANMTDEYRKNISAAEAAMRIRGSKAFIVGWFTYTGMLWTLKICMLVFLSRVTSGLPSAELIMPVFYGVIVSWLANILLFFTACRPFHRYWQIYPDPGKHCTPENPAFYITVLAVNLITDLSIVAIPIPMLVRAQLTIKRKIFLFLLLCAGVFVMVAAILRVFFVFKNADAATPAIWACRETLVAMIVTNAPRIRPVVTARWWRGDTFNSIKQRSPKFSTRSGCHKKRIELGGLTSSSANTYSTATKTHDDASSTEHIVQPTESIGIRAQRDIDVETDHNVDVQQ
ncbi:hypothetical protein BDU57DRAFT_275566 [Ampelomyces quisqualis]|uniref:Rhodopsin domain-containing protein n=1 Tax=Ampelomyces quisqualis TaxID=50730 RepID=A0A6A5QKV7_AMPQU|nr:hypothetical protein BDU57DRAFT_275566 [Ampelomyces quisqualis]